MRFVLDHDVPVKVCEVVRRAGHDCWRAPLPGATPDDDVAVYADNKGAALLSHDRRFADRRRRLWYGKHVWLRCSQLRAESIVAAHLELIVEALSIEPAVVAVTESGVRRLDRLW